MDNKKLYDAITEIDDKYIEEAEKYRPKKMKFKKRYVFSIALAAVAFIFITIGVNNFSNVRYATSSSFTQSEGLYLNDYSGGAEYNNVKSVNGNSVAMDNGVAENSMVNAEPSSAIEETFSDKKLVKTMEISMETKDLDQCVNVFEMSAKSLGGYVERSEINTKGKNRRYSNLVIRIPVNNYDAFKSKMNENATVTKLSENVNDITENYVDTQSYIKSLETEQTALLQLMEKASTVSDIMSVQQRLSSVRSKLESYERRLKSMDAQVSYSTVTISITEVEEIKPKDTSIGAEISEKFKDNLENVFDGLKALFVWLIVSVPYFVVIIIMALVGLLIYKGIKKKYNKK